MQTTPSTQDRVWTVLAHLSALSFGMGILLPVVGWSDQRRKSPYASFQCLQALGYQSLGFTVWLLAYAMIVIIAGVILLVSRRSTDTIPTNPLQSPAMIGLFILIFGAFALYFVLPILAAIACALGRDFRYPFLGNWLARYLEYASSQVTQTGLNEEHGFRWVAAMGHFSILIVLWGMLAPLAAWILQGKHSLFLKFQSAQTVLYQGIATLISLIGGFFYMVSGFLLLMAIEAMGMTDPQRSIGSVGMVAFVVSLVVAALFVLMLPFLHILGQWAGIRVLKGENYHYPLIGNWVEKWIAANSTSQENTV